MKKLNLPLTKQQLLSLKAGEHVLLSGEIITARDAAHKRLADLLNSGAPLPFDLNGKTVYYAGPCPAPDGFSCGACGPTTSGRVDGYTPLMLQNGLAAMIGKGDRSQEVYDAIKQRGSVYFAAIGGAGALYGAAVTSSRVLAFPELLSEAVHLLEIRDFPVIVAIDSQGNSIYKK